MGVSRKQRIFILIWTSIGAFTFGRFVALVKLSRSIQFRNVTSLQTETALPSPFNISSDEYSIHQPSGSCQSIFIDIQSREFTFLKSEQQLVDVVANVTDRITSSMMIRSPQCMLQPNNLWQCESVSYDSHLVMHAWPDHDAICLDVFSCDDESLLDFVSAAQSLFNITDNVTMRWRYVSRGDQSHDNALADEDISNFLYEWMEFDMKQLIASVDTNYQTIDIYDIINPRFRSLTAYHTSLLNDESYESMNPDLYRPDRIVYLDGIMQSRYFGETAYHEALVHPAMITHPNPKRVAIIGGGEGATLREVLKHNTVETVTMIEIDEIMVNVSKEFLPEWSDCSMIIGSTPSCFDDPRTEMIYTDAVQWFIDHFHDATKIAPSLKYDVIIMDALDPSTVSEFSNVLFANDQLCQAIYNSLNRDGILISQLGEDDLLDSPGPHFSPSRIPEYDFMESLSKQGFEQFEDYAEMHGGFLGIWKFKIAFKSRNSSYQRWYSNQALIDLEISTRSMKSLHGDYHTFFLYFDGATMMGYQYPSRIVQEVFCRDVPTPNFCFTGHELSQKRCNSDDSKIDWELDYTSLNIEISSMEDQSHAHDRHRGRVYYKMFGMTATSNIMKQFVKNNQSLSTFFEVMIYLSDHGNETLGELFCSNDNVDNSIELEWNITQQLFDSSRYNPMISRNRYMFPSFQMVD